VVPFAENRGTASKGTEGGSRRRWSAARKTAIEIETPDLRVRVPVATSAETPVAVLGVLRGSR
jgi:hypothetical protein